MGKMMGFQEFQSKRLPSQRQYRFNAQGAGVAIMWLTIIEVSRRDGSATKLVLCLGTALRPDDSTIDCNATSHMVFPANANYAPELQELYKKYCHDKFRGTCSCGEQIMAHDDLQRLSVLLAEHVTNMLERDETAHAERKRLRVQSRKATLQAKEVNQAAILASRASHAAVAPVSLPLAAPAAAAASLGGRITVSSVAEAAYARIAALRQQQVLARVTSIADDEDELDDNEEAVEALREAGDDGE